MFSHHSIHCLYFTYRKLIPKNYIYNFSLNKKLHIGFDLVAFYYLPLFGFSITSIKIMPRFNFYFSTLFVTHIQFISIISTCFFSLNVINYFIFLVQWSPNFFFFDTQTQNLLLPPFFSLFFIHNFKAYGGTILIFFFIFSFSFSKQFNITPQSLFYFKEIKCNLNLTSS